MIKLLIALIPTIALTSYGQLMMKWRVNAVKETVEGLSIFERLFKYLTDPLIFSAYVFALLGSFAWIYAIEKHTVSIAFPVYVGLLFTVVLAGSSLLLHEPFTVKQGIGIALILTGVAVASHA